MGIKWEFVGNHLYMGIYCNSNINILVRWSNYMVIASTKYQDICDIWEHNEDFFGYTGVLSFGNSTLAMEHGHV